MIAGSAELLPENKLQKNSVLVLKPCGTTRNSTSFRSLQELATVIGDIPKRTL